jgi:hypothetical protein
MRHRVRSSGVFQEAAAETDYASLVLELVRNGYFNGETVPLDGAIRMQLR